METVIRGTRVNALLDQLIEKNSILTVRKEDGTFIVPHALRYEIVRTVSNLSACELVAVTQAADGRLPSEVRDVLNAPNIDLTHHTTTRLVQTAAAVAIVLLIDTQLSNHLG